MVKDMAENNTSNVVPPSPANPLPAMTVEERKALIKVMCNAVEFYANNRDWNATLEDVISDLAVGIEEAGLGHDAVSLLKAALELATGKKVKLED